MDDVQLGGRNWGDEISVNEEVGKDFCRNFLQPCLENFGGKSCNDGSRELIPIFHNPHQKS